MPTVAVSRASVYRRPAEIREEDRTIVALIDRQYLARPYYGSRRMAACLATQGHVVNRKRVRRLMRLAGLVAVYQRPNTSQPAVAHKIYPYLLGGLSIERVNQVWCSDVTYILHRDGQGLPLPGGDHGLGEPCWRGGYRTASAPTSVSRHSSKRSANTAGLRRSIPTRACPSEGWGQPVHQRRFHRYTLKRHAITISMDGKSLPPRRRGAATWTTSSSSGCGAASNTRRSTATPTPVSPRPKPGINDIIHLGTANAVRYVYSNNMFHT